MVRRDPTDNYIYAAWKKCDDFFQQNTMYTDTKKCVRFYEGDQWFDENQKDWKKLPTYNFIQPIVDYKVAMVAKNTMVINYSPLNVESYDVMKQACDYLNAYAKEVWEEKKMDTLMWDLVKKGAITGESFLYFGTDDLTPQLIDRTNLFLADEQEENIQAQPFIIIRERRFVEDVRKDAKAAGLEEKYIPLIQKDDPENQVNNENNEVKAGDGKVTCFVYLRKNEDGNVTFARATEAVVYQQEVVIEGLQRYPVAAFVWKRKYNSARGCGEVYRLIPNQIVTNRLLLRREVNNKQTGYARPVYHKDYIGNPESLDVVGAKIEVDGGALVQDVAKAFTYIQPAPMSADGAALQNEIIELTRNLCNASDAATGNIDPEQASGKAINLVIDQNAVLLNEPHAMFKQLVEDTALIWYDYWRIYNPNGLEMAWTTEDGRMTGTIDAATLEALDIRVRVDVSSNNPWSVYANDQEAMNLFGNGYVDFAQYVSLLSDQNHMKPKLEQIVKERQAAEQMQMMQQQMMQPQMQANPMAALMGGGNNVMPGM